MDDVGDNSGYFDDTMREVKLERSRVLLGSDRIDHAEVGGGVKSMLLHVEDTMDPDEFKIPKASYDWVDPAPNTSKGVLTLTKWTTQEDGVAYTTIL